MASRVLLTVLLAVLALAPPARGASASPDNAARAEAKSRFKQGVLAYNEGRFRDAVDLFLAADGLAASAALSFNIARAYERLRDTAAALKYYRDYLRREPAAANAELVRARIIDLEGMLKARGVQQLTVFSDPSAAILSVDGRPVGLTPWTGELTPGKHELSLSKEGYRPQPHSVYVAADHASDFQVRLLPSPAPAAVRAPVSSPSKAVLAVPASRDRASTTGLGPWPWVSLGAGAVALGSAGVFELLRRSAEQDAREETTQLGYQDRLQQMQSRQQSARILTGVGGAFVLLGGALLYVDFQKTESSRSQALITCHSHACMATLQGDFR